MKYTVHDLAFARGTTQHVREALLSLAARVTDYETRLTAVMPADFKDWYQNSREEWPEVAAWVITNLREQRDEADKYAELLRTRSADIIERLALRLPVGDHAVIEARRFLDGLNAKLPGPEGVRAEWSVMRDKGAVK